MGIADVLVHSHGDVCAGLRQEIDAIREFFRVANVVLSEDASEVFSMASQNQIAYSEHDSGVAAKSVVLERVSLVEETVAASLAGWTLEKRRE